MHHAVLLGLHDITVSLSEGKTSLCPSAFLARQLCNTVSLLTVGDVIFTNTNIQPAGAPVPDVQYFWEAFPAGTGKGDRTTYMFTYIDALPQRLDPL